MSSDTIVVVVDVRNVGDEAVGYCFIAVGGWSIRQLRFVKDMIADDFPDALCALLNAKPNGVSQKPRTPKKRRKP